MHVLSALYFVFGILNIGTVPDVPPGRRMDGLPLHAKVLELMHLAHGGRMTDSRKLDNQ